MASNSSSSGGGVGFVGLLTIVFIVLKLTNVIAWEWVWVLAPLWISALFGVAILAVFGIVLGVAALSDRSARKKRIRSRREFDKPRIRGTVHR